MDKKVARLRFPNQGKYVSIDHSKPNQGPFGGYVINFLDSPDVSCNFDLTEPDSLFALVPSGLDGNYLGADATQYSASLETQLYTVTHREGYESWHVEYSADGSMLFAYIPYGTTYTAVQLTVEIQ